MNAKDNDNIDIYIAAKQISQELFVSNITVNDDELYLVQGDKENTISLDNNRIVKKPGFIVYAFDIDDLNFFREGDYVYMNAERNDQNYILLIGAIYEKIK